MLFVHKAIIEKILNEQGPQEEGADLCKIREMLKPTEKGEPASFPEVLTTNRIYIKMKGETASLLGYNDREYPDLFNDSRLRCLESKLTDDTELFSFESKIILARRAYAALRTELYTAEELIMEALEARRLYEQFQCTEPSLLSYEQVRGAITGQPPLSVRHRDLTPTKRRNRFSRPVEDNQTFSKVSPNTPLPKTKSPLIKELLDIDKELDVDIKRRSKSVISDPKNSDCYEVYLKSILLKVTKVTKEGDRVGTRKRTATDY